MMSLGDLLTDQIRAVYGAESQFVRALPWMVEGVSTPALRRGLDEILVSAIARAERLERIADECHVRLGGRGCKAMDALIAECRDAIRHAGNAAVCDSAVAYAVQRAGHYEIASYSACISLAGSLNLDIVVQLLGISLEEVCEADERLVEILNDSLYPTAPRHARGRGLFRRRSDYPHEFAPEPGA